MMFARPAVIAALLVGSAGSAGCGPRLNQDHCMLRDGTTSCDDDTTCVAVVGGGLVGDATNGCVPDSDLSDIEPSWIEVAYGLPPTELPRSDELLLESRSVLGVLARLSEQYELGSVCPLGDALPAPLANSAAVDRVVQTRRRIDRQADRRSADPKLVALSAADAEAVSMMNGLIGAWLYECQVLAEPPQGETTGGDSSDSGTTGSSTAATDSDSTTGGPQCQGDDDCTDPAFPVCSDEQCVECTTGNPSRCDGSTPVCDPADNQCVACSEHAECETACNFFDGSCVDGPIVDVGTGQEFTSITEAVTALAPTMGGVVRIHGPTTFSEEVTVPPGMVVAFFADETSQPTWEGGADAPLTAEGTALVRGMHFTDSPTVGLRVAGGRLWLDDVVALRNEFHWVHDGGTFVLRNTIMNGSFAAASGPTLVVENGSTATLIASTVVSSTSAANDTDFAIVCDGSTSTTIRNSLVTTVTGDAPQGSCPEAEFITSAATGPTNGDTSLDIGALDPSWFVAFPDDLHLSPAGYEPLPLDILGVWLEGDPPADIDGDPRAGVDGAPDFVGADVPVR